MYSVPFFTAGDPAKTVYSLMVWALNGSDAACEIVRRNPDAIVCDYPKYVPVQGVYR